MTVADQVQEGERPMTAPTSVGQLAQDWLARRAEAEAASDLARRAQDALRTARLALVRAARQGDVHVIEVGAERLRILEDGTVLRLGILDGGER